MSGETDLAILLASMKPELLETDYVFVSLVDKHYEACALYQAKAMFMEDEGMTLVVPLAIAQQYDLSFSGVFNCITLTVHSSLEAVGLTAAFANKLKEYGISANVIAGFYHDHIFVQKEKCKEALIALESFAR